MLKALTLFGQTLVSPLNAAAAGVRKRAGIGLMVVALGLAFLAVPALSAAAEDIVYLTSGKYIKGEILRETDDEVEIKGVLDGIPTTTTLKKSSVLSITRGEKSEPAKQDAPPEPAPSRNTFEKGPETPAAKDDEPDPAAANDISDLKDKPDYIRIPLAGEFGIDILPKGVSDALTWAKKAGVKHVVFEIDSPGGYVWAANKIMKLIADYDSDFTFTMVVKRAISASVWPTFSCEQIFILPDATFGGAVAFKVSQAGNAEVDGKLNKIFAAELQAMAEKHGHNGQVVRAMILTSERLYAAKKKGSERWEMLAERPHDSASYAEVRELSNGRDGVVTLTGKQTIEYGIARSLADLDDRSVAVALGNSEYKSAGKRGAVFMQTAASQLKAFAKQLEAMQERMQEIGEDTAEGARKNDARAVENALGDLERLLNRVSSLRDKAEKLGVLELFPGLDSNIKKLRDAVVKARQEVRRAK